MRIFRQKASSDSKHVRGVLCLRALLLLFVLLLPLLSACTVNTQPVSTYFFSMDTVMSLTVYAKNERSGNKVLSDAESEIERINTLLTAMMGSMQGTAAGEGTGFAALSESDRAEAEALLARVMEIAEMTDGAFDPTVYPLMKAWGFYSGDYHVPDDSELADLLAGVGYEKYGADPDVLLDLGAVGKGYAAQKTRALLQEKGITSAIIDLGGNVSLLGSKPDGASFVAGICDPDDPSALIARVSVSDCAVVTSGSYERCFEMDGITYSHILDPHTGRPVDNTLTSVTVISEDDVLSDALSTALFVMGRDGAIEFYRKNVCDFNMVLVEKDRSITITEGLTDCFQAEDPDANVEVIRDDS